MAINTRPAPLFIADEPALDFLNTLARPWGDEIEWLSNGQDLLNWLGQADMVSKEELTKFREETDIEKCDVIAAQARDLRKWLRTFVSKHAGKALNSSVITELDGLNKLLAKDNNYYQIEIKNRQNENQKFNENKMLFLWNQHRCINAPDKLLLPLAQAIGKFICRNDFKNVKPCKGHECILWFLDISHNHTRNWCSMAVCGNRAKAAAFRERKKKKMA